MKDDFGGDQLYQMYKITLEIKEIKEVLQQMLYLLQMYMLINFREQMKEVLKDEGKRDKN